MTNLNLVCLEFQECKVLSSLKSSLRETLSSKIILKKDNLKIKNFLHPDRGQYDAGGILSLYDKNNTRGRTILITSVDLYIPIFTFVFGLAKLNGLTGIVSAHRLKSEFYGLPSNEDQLQSRLAKEIIHEYGHLLNLRHCSYYHCVMASSNTVDDLDIKGDQFCKSCLIKMDGVLKN
jgi:archaemetzincin